MTTLLHLVSDDITTPSGLISWSSRVGSYVASETVQSIGGGPAEDPHGRTFRTGNHTYSMSVSNNPASPIVPGPGLLRVYEMILAFDGVANPTKATITIGHNSSDGLLTNTIDAHALTQDFQVENAGGFDLTGEAFANPTKFHYLTWIYDFTVLPAISWRMYDNGTLIETYTSPIVHSTGWTAHQSSAAKFTLNGNGVPTTNFLELMIHDVALTDAQVAQRAQNCLIFAG